MNRLPLDGRGKTPRPLSSALVACLLLAGLAAVALPGPALGIEMFTFFGDGSRIGLPSLEVPVEAYPGIPLRSDRLRARRRAAQLGPGSTVRLGPPGVPTRPGGMMIRAMPTTVPGGVPGGVPGTATPPPVR